MKLESKKTFLLRQETKNGKTIDIIAIKGEEIEVTDREAKIFAPYFTLPDKDSEKKKESHTLTTKQ